MNFIFVTREGYKDAGARIRCYNFSERLRENGIYSKVFSFRDKLFAKSGIEEINFKWSEKIRLCYQACKILSKENNISAYIVNRFNYHALSVWFLSWKKKIPIIFDMDDWEAREDLGRAFGIIPKSKAEYLTVKLARKSKLCIAASRYLQSYLLQFNKHVYYLPTGVDTGIFSPVSCIGRRKDFVFSWHGSVNRIELVRYIKFVIECFLTLYKKYSFIKFVIAADGIFGERLAKLIRSYHCENIIYKGWIDYDNISSYLNNVDCGLIPLLEKTRFNLSKSPVKLLEYMAKAKPVIASCVGEANYIIKSEYNGFLVSGRDEFIFNMEKVIKNPDLIKSIGVAARKTIEESYSLNFLGERFANILKNDFNNSFNLQ